MHSLPAPIIPAVVCDKKSHYDTKINKNNDNIESNVNGCRRSFEDFVSMSTQILADDNRGTVMRTEDASPETTSLVFQGLSVSCLGESCSVCDKKGCHAFDNTSEAFAFFLAQLRYNFFNGFPKVSDRFPRFWVAILCLNGGSTQ